MKVPPEARRAGAATSLVAILTVAWACAPGEGGDAPYGVMDAGEPAGGSAIIAQGEGTTGAMGGVAPSDVRPDATDDWPRAADSIPGTPWTQADWEIFQAAMEAASEARLDTLPLGDAIARMGALFLGTPYVPRTLEVPGPERLVVNLRGLDCVTFVENVLALTRFQRVHGVALLENPPEARRRYEEDLIALRYRGGRVAGYPSRLHYFSEWLGEGEAAGRLRLVTGELGGVPDPEPVGFMTAHREAYPQLVSDAALEGVREVEERLAEAGPRIYLPQSAIGAAAGGIRNGDIVAATSTLPGLDVAHTGIAWWVDGDLHLLHAPLVGSTVVLSQRPLAQRIREIGSQDGIMVARPLNPWFTGEG